MNHETKVSIKQTKKMKKEGLVSQTFMMKVTGVFRVTDDPDQASALMGEYTSQIIKHTSLLGQYMTGGKVDGQ